MKLKAVVLGYESGHYTVLLDNEVAEQLDVRANDRVKVSHEDREVIAIVTLAKNFPRDSIGLYDDVARALAVSDGQMVEVEAVEPPASLKIVRKKLARARLTPEEARQIIEDIVDGKISEIELTAFVTALHFQGMSVEEALNFTMAMVDTGERLRLNRRPIVDKHSLGGVPGDKTSLLVVPIIASLGYTIPKTSSRAITSAAGTADRMEVLAPVSLSIEEMKRVVEKTNGCIVWGGSLRLAPADDIIIRVEYPLGIDPFFVPSILAKKLAVGSTHVVLDIPTGRGTKARTIEDARRIARDFIDIGGRLGLNIVAVSTYGEEPVGHAVGPALEAREALQALMTMKPSDVVDKAVSIAGVLLEMVGTPNGREVALRALKTGKAERKLREIIEAQGGDPNVKPEDIPVGDKKFTLYAEDEGFVFFIDNALIALTGKTAGSPRDKGAGVYVHVKLGDKVKKGDPLLTVYAESSVKLQAAEKLLMDSKPVRISRLVGRRMLLEKIDLASLRAITIER